VKLSPSLHYCPPPPSLVGGWRRVLDKVIKHMEGQSYKQTAHLSMLLTNQTIFNILGQNGHIIE
jgi:hypothetical protein